MDYPSPPPFKLFRHDVTKTNESVYFDVYRTAINALLPAKDRLEMDVCVEIVFNDGVFVSHRYLKKNYHASEDDFTSWTPTQRFCLVIAPEIALAVAQHEATYKFKQQLYANSTNTRGSQSLSTESSAVGAGKV